MPHRCRCGQNQLVLMKTTDKSWLIFLGVFALVGVVCIGIAWYVWSKNRSLKASGIETAGVVVGHLQGWRDRHHRSNAVAVVVQYADAQNSPRTYTSSTYTSPALFDVGETVRLWYLEGQPDQVLLEGKDEWLLPAILGGFGLVFSLIGLPGLIRELLK